MNLFNQEYLYLDNNVDHIFWPFTCIPPIPLEQFCEPIINFTPRNANIIASLKSTIPSFGFTNWIEAWDFLDKSSNKYVFFEPPPVQNI